MTTTSLGIAATEPLVEQQRSARRAAAERVRPIRALQAELEAQWRIALDLVEARTRVVEGRTAYEPMEVIASAGDLIVPFMRATRAMERAGLFSWSAIASARERRFEVLPSVIAWLAGERRPIDPARHAVRFAASVVAGSILRRASAEVVRELSLDHWTRPTCPCCGSVPELAAPADRGRVLLCSRCDTTWPCTHAGCLGCRAHDAPLVGRITAPPIGYALRICNACGRYLKEKSDGQELDPLIERILTAEIDEAAESRGLRL